MTITYETQTRLSDSVLWAAQQRYFDERGIKAWEEVPYFITSNPVIADQYAQIMVSFLQDQARKPNYDPKQPIYILELGTGTGQFSFYCLKRLCELHESLNLEIPFCYLMSDFTRANLEFWQQHDNFKPYLDNGVLDFVVYDCGPAQSLQLEQSKHSLDALTNPLIVVANYLFDTIRSDVFRADSGQLLEGLLTLRGQDDNILEGQPKALKNLDEEFEFQAIEAKGYYAEEVFNQVLAGHSEQILNGSFLFPIGGLRCLQYLQQLAPEGLLVLSSDKGYDHLEEIERRKAPEIICHGSFSLSVNFHALAEYCRTAGGDARLQDARQGLKSTAFLTRGQFADYVHTAQAVEQTFNGFSAADYFELHKQLRENKKSKIERILAHMNLCKWDPYVFDQQSNAIRTQLAGAAEMVKLGFREGAAKLVDNLYLIPASSDHCVDIGILFHTLEDFQGAIAHYLKSIELHGEKFSNCYNVGICYHSVDDKKTALDYFLKAVKHKTSNDNRAEEWIAHIEA